VASPAAAQNIKPNGLTTTNPGRILNHMVLDRSPTLDRVFHALAHPARRAILRRLSDSEQNLSELAAPMKMSFPAASKHVRVLERAKLVQRRISGRSHMCRLNASPLKQVAEWTEGYRERWENTFAALDNLLAEMQEQEQEKGAKHGRNK
jgi:DNA-binding transcriptional ArsR family regulator